MYFKIISAVLFLVFLGSGVLLFDTNYIVNSATIDEFNNSCIVNRIVYTKKNSDKTTIVQNSVESMRANYELKTGMYVQTTGYYKENDGGASLYCIRSRKVSDTEDDGGIIFLTNGKVAELVTDGTVNVKQFGAKGDGITDDTFAIQKAVNFGNKIYFPTATYVTDEISVNKNVEIDCGKSEFIVVGTRLFSVVGREDAVLALQSDYIANQADYTLSDTGYTGLGLLTGRCNRSKYQFSFFGSFRDGILCDRIPADFTDVSVIKVTPVTCTIQNVANVTFANTHDGEVIYCNYGLHCVFRNIRIMNECYSVVNIHIGYKCIIENVYAKLPLYGGSKPNTYATICGATMRCVIRNCYLHNPYWHCWTSSSRSFAMYTLIENSEMYTDKQFSILDHNGGYGTTIVNTVTSGINLKYAGKAIGCKIVSRNDTNKTCSIVLPALSINDGAERRIEKITFYPAKDTKSVVGVLLRSFAFDNEEPVGLKEKYFDNIVIKDVSVAVDIPYDNIMFYPKIPVSVTSVNVGKITIDNCNCNLFRSATNVKYDFTNSNIIIRNIIRTRPNGYKININPLPGANVTIENAEMSSITSANLSF